MQTIALFGTSADPPTAGHQAILGWLSYHFDHVAVWAADNPFKSHQTPLNHRMAMLQLLIDDISPPRQNIWLYPELGRPRTWHTLSIAQTLWRNARFTLVIGADLVYQLPNWYRVEELLAQVNLLIVPRPGFPLQESALAELRRRGATVAIADFISVDTSSTAYRNSGDTQNLTPLVADYIHREHLYACQETSRERQPIR